MADVRLLIQEEGRAARNLIAFNVPLSSNNTEKVTKKPPSVPRLTQAGSLKRSMKPPTRVRSASTGRDKKSELQARYWAFLFGNLQRAVDGIYQTCEEDENISECKEVILVLENYTRDFHNLIEWFKVKWAYENSPPPLRRTPLAWEVRKTSPCRIWNPNMIPKSTSPVHRMSPTESICRSPVEQVICENKVINMDNKMNHITEEPVQTILKDNKNNVSKSNTTNAKERYKTATDKGSNHSNRDKSNLGKIVNKPIRKFVSSVKSTTSVCDQKISDINSRDTKTKHDVKTPPRQSKAMLQGNLIKTYSYLAAEKNDELLHNQKNVQLSSKIVQESSEKEPSKHINVHNKSDGQTTLQVKPLANKNDLSSTKNEINAKVKKQSKGKDGDNTTIDNNTSTNKVIEIDLSSKENNGSIHTNKNIIKVQNKINQTIKRQTSINNNNANNKQIAKSSSNVSISNASNKSQNNTARPTYSVVSQAKLMKSMRALPETLRSMRSKTTLTDKISPMLVKIRPGSSVIVRQRLQPLDNKISEQGSLKKEQNRDINGSVEVLTKQTAVVKEKDDSDGWQTVRSRYRRGSTHNLNMSMRFHKPSTATSLPALSIQSPSEKNNKNCLTPDGNGKRKATVVGKKGKDINNEAQKFKGEILTNSENTHNLQDTIKKNVINLSETNSTSVIAAIFKNDAELLEKRIKQFMAAQAERERIILEEERQTEEADSQRSQQLSDEEASLKRQILELESTDIDIDTETDETDGELALEIEDDQVELTTVNDNLSLEERYENMLEGMSWDERVDTLAQLRALVARHPGRALELHQKLSSPSRKRSLPETLRRYQAKQACAQYKRQQLLMEKSQRLRELLNKVEDVKSAKSQLIEDMRVRMEMRLKRAEENRTQHLLEIVRKAHDEDSKLKEIAFINELEAQNKRHDFMALCQEQEERLQGIQEERQRRQEEKAAKEAAAEERRRALEAERQLRIQKMKQARREREERVGKMQLEREKERQELAREKARDREERLSALHAAQLANQEELQKKIAQKQQESARRHVENIEHIRQRAVELSISRTEEIALPVKSKVSLPFPDLKRYFIRSTIDPNELYLLSHVKGKLHLTAVPNTFDAQELSRDELQLFNTFQVQDVPGTVISNWIASNVKTAKEKQKALERRCKQIKQRMTLRGEEWEEEHKNDKSQATESTNKVKFRRNLKVLDRLYSNHAKTTWCSVTIVALERCLGEITRAFSKSCQFDQHVFHGLSGFTTLTNLLSLCLQTQNVSPKLPNTSVLSLCRAYKSSISGNTTNIETILLSNKILVILDLLLQRLEALTNMSDKSQIREIASNSTGNGVIANSLVQLLCSLIPEKPFQKPTLQSRVQDIAAYLIAGGLVERVHRHSRALIDTDYFLEQDHEAPLLVSMYDLLFRICCHLRRSPDQENTAGHEEKSNAEQTDVEDYLLSDLIATEAAGAIDALYAAVALATSNQKGTSPTPHQTTASQNIRILIVRGLKLLRSVAELDHQKLQNLLGAEGISLHWRLIASHVITRLSRDSISDKQETGSVPNTSGTYILSELFQVLGYFVVNNPENQLVLQTAAAGPSVLQQLCTLPFPFYADPRLASYTLPTLLAATHHNPEATAILSRELSYQFLEEYKNSDEGKLNRLLRLLKDTPSA